MSAACTPEGCKAYVTALGNPKPYMLVVPLGMHPKTLEAFDFLSYTRFPTYKGAQHIANAINAFEKVKRAEQAKLAST